ncbi:hypothetical protein [Collinsella vaginalis]|uniref:hypothetical protein n=1 Tax=Collinsella vaginalis TaxID=1870987 RepID=UPI000A271EA6|nr:hypothetical protein [Collinsella vaginalis]
MCNLPGLYFGVGACLSAWEGGMRSMGSTMSAVFGRVLPNAYDTFSPELVIGLIGVAVLVIIIAIVLRLRKKD